MATSLQPLLGSVRARRAARRITDLSDDIDRVLDELARYDDPSDLARELATLEEALVRETLRARRALRSLDGSERSLAAALRRALEAFDACSDVSSDPRSNSARWAACIEELRAALRTPSAVLRSALGGPAARSRGEIAPSRAT